MPYTPLHIGPPLLVAYPFRRDLDLLAVAISAVILDLGPLYRGISGTRPIHAYSHTFLVAIIAAIVLTLALSHLHTYIEPWRQWLGTPSKKTHGTLISCLLGTTSHVFLDALLYQEMHPFFPLKGNPLCSILPGDATQFLVYLFVTSTTILVLGIYAYTSAKRA